MGSHSNVKMSTAYSDKCSRVLLSAVHIRRRRRSGWIWRGRPGARI